MQSVLSKSSEEQTNSPSPNDKRKCGENIPSTLVESLMVFILFALIVLWCYSMNVCIFIGLDGRYDPFCPECCGCRKGPTPLQASHNVCWLSFHEFRWNGCFPGGRRITCYAQILLNLFNLGFIQTMVDVLHSPPLRSYHKVNIGSTFIASPRCDCMRALLILFSLEIILLGQFWIFQEPFIVIYVFIDFLDHPHTDLVCEVLDILQIWQIWI